MFTYMKERNSNDRDRNVNMKRNVAKMWTILGGNHERDAEVNVGGDEGGGRRERVKSFRIY